MTKSTNTKTKTKTKTKTNTKSITKSITKNKNKSKSKHITTLTIKQINDNTNTNANTNANTIIHNETSDFNSQRSLTSSKLLDKLTNFQSIFSYNKKKDTKILMLKKLEFDIFYCCKYKYPLLVMENLKSITKIVKNKNIDTDTVKDKDTDIPIPNVIYIDRTKIVDPFIPDILIPAEYSLSLDDYKKYMEYGGSMGHNAPAGQHKTNINVYNETFLLSNITPQEMVFNGSVWVILETWCKYLSNNKNIQNIKVFTGSIPNTVSYNFDGVKINIPYKMFKIVCFENASSNSNSNSNNNSTSSTSSTSTYPELYYDIFIFNNTSINKNSLELFESNITEYDLGIHIISKKSHKWFQNFSGIDLDLLFKYYGYNNYKSLTKSYNSNSIKNIIPLTLKISQSIHNLLHKNLWIAYLIYSPTLEHLENVWDNCKTFEKEFINLQYHKQFYEATKTRLLRDRDDNTYPKLFGFEHSIKEFSKLYKGRI